MVVSTDCIDIAEVSRNSGADVIMRPDAIIGDKAASEDAIIHILETLKLNQKYIHNIQMKNIH